MRRSAGIRDIVNRDIVNLTNCEHEPIHIPGSIQQHGFLLGLKKGEEEGLLIDFCSENCLSYLETSHNVLLGKRVSDLFGTENEATLEDFFQKSPSVEVANHRLWLAGHEFYCSLHISGNILILEAEPIAAIDRDIAVIQQQTQQLLLYMQQSHTLREICALIAEDTRKLTGYDRVMIYRFDEQYNGEVIAESKREDLEPFLGLHYPHTDIPVQARQLYIKNLLRLITDVYYAPSPIFTVNDDENKNLDLGMAVLRSTSPIHIQYLINMGVGATLTISLVHQNRLWGLIACHHYSPKNISPAIRNAAQMQGHFITSQIEIRQNNEHFESAAQVNNALQSLIAQPFALDQSSFQSIAETPEILKLCNANGVAILVHGNIYTAGVTPSANEIIALAQWLSAQMAEESVHTTSVHDIVPGLEIACENVAGMVYHRLNGDEDCIMWFRQETITQVNWAGDPNKSIVKDANGLSPRKSFERWQETVRCHSQKWLHYELEAAANFALHLHRHRSAILLAEEERKYRTLSEILNETNQELEKINWISTHDLQEPLRKIQMYTSRLLTKSSDGMEDEVLRSIEKISSSASRMRTLIDDILVYNRLRKTDTFFNLVDLNLLIRDILTDYSDLIEEKNARVRVAELPKVSGMPLMLRQLFVNLIHNSLKFTLPDRQPVIELFAEKAIPEPHRDSYAHAIVIQDNGIGFEQQYAETIFDIFKRLHSATDFPGSGIGLSLARKVMQSHGGDIMAEGSLNGGARFTLYFPAIR